MADWRDVMTTRTEAESARSGLHAYGKRLEEIGDQEVALAIVLASYSLVLELRALAVLIDHAATDHARTLARAL